VRYPYTGQRLPAPWRAFAGCQHAVPGRIARRRGSGTMESTSTHRDEGAAAGGVTAAVVKPFIHYMHSSMQIGCRVQIRHYFERFVAVLSDETFRMMPPN
jgi:hypothetical protein